MFDAPPACSAIIRKTKKMKKACAAFVVIVGLLFLANPAQAQSSRLYFAGYLGLNAFRDSGFNEKSVPTSGDIKFQNTQSFGGALGLRLTPKWRVEGELSYRKADMDNIDFSNAGTFPLGGSMETWLWMVNFYYDIDMKWKNVEPFISFGGGLAFNDTEIDDSSGLAPDALGNSKDFAWQLGSGLRYRVKPNMAFTGSYRILGTSDIEVGTYDFGYSTHEFRLGLEYDIPVDLFQ